MKTFRNTLMTIGSMGLLCLAALPCSASSYNESTGTATYTLLTPSVNTGEWAGAPRTAAAITVGNQGTGWASIGGASWIGPAADQTNATRPSSQSVGVTANYATSFTLAANEISTASLAMTLAADDYVTVTLNGNVIFSSTAPMWTASQSIAAVTTDAFYAIGSNTLNFFVTNATGGPTGVIANVLVTTDPITNATPEPATFIPLGLSLVIGGLFLRRRNQVNA